jgi:hypothetical protein
MKGLWVMGGEAWANSTSPSRSKCVLHNKWLPMFSKEALENKVLETFESKEGKR